VADKAYFYTPEYVLDEFKGALSAFPEGEDKAITASVYATLRKAVLDRFSYIEDFRIESFLPPNIIYRMEFEGDEDGEEVYFISVGKGVFECVRG